MLSPVFRFHTLGTIYLQSEPPRNGDCHERGGWNAWLGKSGRMPSHYPKKILELQLSEIADEHLMSYLHEMFM